MTEDLKAKISNQLFQNKLGNLFHNKEVKDKGPNLVKGQMTNIEAKNYSYFQERKKCTISTLAEETVIKFIIKKNFLELKTKHPKMVIKQIQLVFSAINGNKPTDG